MCQIRLRGKPPGLLLICAIMEFHANKLSWLTVTVQWLGSTSVTWPWRASSLSTAIMRKWSFAIELCNGKYWLISALIGCFNCVIGVWAYRVASNCSVVMCIMIHPFDFVSTLLFFFSDTQQLWRNVSFLKYRKQNILKKIDYALRLWADLIEAVFAYPCSGLFRISSNFSM